MNVSVSALKKKANQRKRTWLLSRDKNSASSPGLEALKKQALARKNNWQTSNSSLATQHTAWVRRNGRLTNKRQTSMEKQREQAFAH